MKPPNYVEAASSIHTKKHSVRTYSNTPTHKLAIIKKGNN